MIVITPGSCWASSGTKLSQVWFKSDSVRTNIRAITAATEHSNYFIIYGIARATLYFVVSWHLARGSVCPKEPLTKKKQRKGWGKGINQLLTLSVLNTGMSEVQRLNDLARLCREPIKELGIESSPLPSKFRHVESSVNNKTDFHGGSIWSFNQVLCLLCGVLCKYRTTDTLCRYVLKQTPTDFRGTLRIQKGTLG